MLYLLNNFKKCTIKAALSLKLAFVDGDSLVALLSKNQFGDFVVLVCLAVDGGHSSTHK